MARFQFRLATLLRLREAVRDERRAQLAEAIRAEQKLLEQRDERRGELIALQSSVRTASAQGTVDVDRLVDAQRYDAVVRAELSLIADHLVKINAEVERRRQLLVAADRDVRVLERLHETQRQRHAQTEAQQVAKQLDEIGQRGWQREEVG